MHITYGLYNSPLGEMVIGQTEKGLCWLGFMGKGAEKGDGLERMKSFFTGDVSFMQDDKAATLMGERVLTAWESGRMHMIDLDLQGTDFQRTVWDSLMKTSKGQVKTYGQVACEIGKPGAARAVGTAVGSNPVSLLVPCHRIVPEAGGVGNYLWGSDMKEELLNEESA